MDKEGRLLLPVITVLGHQAGRRPRSPPSVTTPDEARDLDAPLQPLPRLVLRERTGARNRRRTRCPTPCGRAQLSGARAGRLLAGVAPTAPRSRTGGATSTAGCAALTIALVVELLPALAGDRSASIADIAIAAVAMGIQSAAALTESNHPGTASASWAPPGPSTSRARWRLAQLSNSSRSWPCSSLWLSWRSPPFHCHNRSTPSTGSASEHRHQDREACLSADHSNGVGCLTVFQAAP